MKELKNKQQAWDNRKNNEQTKKQMTALKKCNKPHVTNILTHVHQTNDNE